MSDQSGAGTTEAPAVAAAPGDRRTGPAGAPRSDSDATGATATATATTARRARAEAEVAGFCRDLIRIDTSNPTNPERPAAEYVAEKLADVGLQPVVLESEPGRASVVVRIAGADPGRDALLIHGHLDVVAANADDWRVPPFSGELRGGCIWGRGAVDMKGSDATTLAVVRSWAGAGRKPPRDLVLAFVADEEAGGAKGARWLADNHAGLFDGCTESISEVGGFSMTLPGGRRIYPVQTAQRGMAWMRLRATGRTGHGSLPNEANAVTALADAVSRIGHHRWPIRLTATVQDFLHRVNDAIGSELDPGDQQALVEKLGQVARLLAASTRNSANPTMLDAGYKINVIPGAATARIDGRFLPGHDDEFYATIDDLLGPDVTRETEHHDIALETTFDGALVDAMTASLGAEDPEGVAVPYCLFGGTDDKSFSRLGIRGFGFSPLLLGDDLDFLGMFHGIDERVPVEGLRFGVRVLDRLLQTC